MGEFNFIDIRFIKIIVMVKCNYKIFPDKRLIIRFYKGPASFKKLIECVNASGQDSLYDPDYNVINDFREIGSGVKIKEVNEIFGYVKGHTMLYGQRKSAFIIKSPDQPVFRMIPGLLKREDKVSVQTFTTLEEAIKWIGLPLSDLTPIENCINELRVAI